MKKKCKKILLNLNLCLMAFVMFFSGYQIYDTQKQQNQATELYKSVSGYICVPGTQESSLEKESSIEVDFSSLRKINPNIVAWIYIEGTEINYPVVQYSDNDYYLNTLFNGEKNSAGSIFLDCENLTDFSSQHNIVYGHNMKNGTMFGTLSKYKKQEFFDTHKTGVLVTPNKNYKIDFFSAYVCKTDNIAWKTNFASNAEYEAWLKETVSSSDFKSDIIPKTTDKIITLSTCSYEFDDARFVLVGVMK